MRNLHKAFAREDGEVTRAIDGIDLDVYSGEILILLGPSGCGKTTLLRALSGLDSPDSGTIKINDITCFSASRRSNVPPERRPVSMVFQSYGLWPHMTVFDNVAYPLRAAKVAKAEIQQRVGEIIATVGIDGLEQQYPTQLSGGQQQRVALARAVVSASDVVLFDEPLSNVDAKVRDQLRIEILRLQRQLGFTAVYVTHDQDEAMALGTRIAVLDQGRIAQLGPPREIYEHPASAYVARFVGTVDEMPATVTDRSAPGQLHAQTENGDQWLVHTDAELPDRVVLMARPERWIIHAERPEGPNVLAGEVNAALFLAGSRTECLVRTAIGLIRVWAGHGRAPSEGERVWLSVAPDDLLVFAEEQS
ncbi:ABC transporter ATP-binding protein [Prauserella oleivorans]